MTVSIQKWGNSQGIRIPKSVLEDFDLKLNDEISINIENGKIVLEKTKKRKNIKELFKDYKGNYQAEEYDWGEAVGKEIW